MKKSLIICPVGNPVPKLDDFDNENHWRWCDDGRLYETFVVSYNNFLPNGRTYDKFYTIQGMKWAIAKKLLKTFDYTQYEYIGFLDDDLLITRDAINKSLQIASALEAKMFQLSVDKDSDCSYNILYQNPDLMFSETNFIEVMAPFIHTSILPTIEKFWDKYDINTGWGLDSVLCNIVGEKALVIHNHCMIHPKKQVSDYDKASATNEWHEALYRFYPQFMKEEYGIADAQIPHPQILRRWTKS